MRTLLRRVLPLFGVIALLQTGTANAQALDESFRADMQKLLEVTGSAQLGTQVASMMAGSLLDALKTSQPAIPERAVAIVKEVLDAEFAKAFVGPDSLTDQLIVIYAKHFTHEDVRNLLEFYSSDLGKKTIASLPTIFQESATAGQQWAQKQMPRIAAVLDARLRAEGFVK